MTCTKMSVEEGAVIEETQKIGGESRKVKLFFGLKSRPHSGFSTQRKSFHLLLAKRTWLPNIFVLLPLEI